MSTNDGDDDEYYDGDDSDEEEINKRVEEEMRSVLAGLKPIRRSTENQLREQHSYSSQARSTPYDEEYRRQEELETSVQVRAKYLFEKMKKEQEEMEMRRIEEEIERRVQEEARQKAELMLREEEVKRNEELSLQRKRTEDEHARRLLNEATAKRIEQEVAKRVEEESQRITELFLQKKLDGEKELELQRRQKEKEYEQQLQQQQQVFLQQQQQQQQQFQLQVQQLQQQKQQQKKLSLARQSARQVPLQTRSVSIPVGRRSGGLVRKSYLAPIAEGEEDEGKDYFGDSADVQAVIDKNEKEEIKPQHQIGIPMHSIVSKEQLSQPFSSHGVHLSAVDPLPRGIDSSSSNQAPVLSVRPPTVGSNTSNDSGLSAAARGYMDAMKSKLLVASVSPPVVVPDATKHEIAEAPSSSSSSSSSSSLSMSRAQFGDKQDAINNHDSNGLNEKKFVTVSTDNMTMITSRPPTVDLSLNSKHELDFSLSTSLATSASPAIPTTLAISSTSIVDKQQDVTSVVLTKEEIEQRIVEEVERRVAARDAANRAAQIELAAAAAAALVLKQLGSSSSSNSNGKQQLGDEKLEDGIDASTAAPTISTATQSAPPLKDVIVEGLDKVTAREQRGTEGKRVGENAVGGESGEKEIGVSKPLQAVHTPRMIAFDLPPHSPEVDVRRGQTIDAPPPSEERPHTSSSSSNTTTTITTTVTSSLPNPRPPRTFTATPDRLRAVAAQLVPLSMNQTSSGTSYGLHGIKPSSAVGLKRPIGYTPSPPSTVEAEGTPSEVEFLDASFSGQKYTGLELVSHRLMYNVIDDEDTLSSSSLMSGIQRSICCCMVNLISLKSQIMVGDILVSVNDWPLINTPHQGTRHQYNSSNGNGIHNGNDDDYDASAKSHFETVLKLLRLATPPRKIRFMRSKEAAASLMTDVSTTLQLSSDDAMLIYDGLLEEDYVALTADVAMAARLEEAVLQAQQQAENHAHKHAQNQAQKQAPKRNSGGSGGTTRSKKAEKKNSSQSDPSAMSKPSSVSVQPQPSTASLTSTPDVTVDPLIPTVATISPAPHPITTSSSSKEGAKAALLGSSTFGLQDGSPSASPDVYLYEQREITKENETSPIPRAPAEPSMIDSEIDCAASALTTNTGHARDMLANAAMAEITVGPGGGHGGVNGHSHGQYNQPMNGYDNNGGMGGAPTASYGQPQGQRGAGTVGTGRPGGMQTKKTTGVDQNKSRKGISGFMKAVGRAFGLRKSSKDRSNTDGYNMTHEQQQQHYYQQQLEQGYQPQQGLNNGDGYQQYQQQQFQSLPPGYTDQQQGYNPNGDAGTLEPRQRSFSSSSSQRQLQQQQQQIPPSLPASIHFKSFPNAGSLGVKLMYHNLMFIDGKGIAQSINCLVITGFANGGSSPSPESIREGDVLINVNNSSIVAPRDTTATISPSDEAEGAQRFFQQVVTIISSAKTPRVIKLFRLGDARTVTSGQIFTILASSEVNVLTPHLSSIPI